MKNRTLYTNELSKYIDNELVKIIIGIRRSGKSFLLKLLKKQLNEKGISTKNIIELNFESMKYFHYRNYKALYKYIMEKSESLNGKIYLIFDEIQEVSKWENAIRSFLVDLDCDIYLTGSNAHLLSGELSTYLAGRFIELKIYPLSFKEYLNFHEIEDNKIENAFYDYLKYGGFPGLYNLPNDENVYNQYLDGIYNSVLLKDVIQRNNIRNPELLKLILWYIMDNIGQIFSGKNISNYLKEQGRKVGIETIYKYIEALIDAMVIYPAKRYDVKGKKILKRLEKYYLADLGLRFNVLGYRKNDISQLLENIVYLELLRKGYKVYVGKENNRAIDFIGIKRNEKLYIQVTYILSNDKVIEREYKPLRKVEDNYPKLVLSLDKMPIGVQEGIQWMNIIDFLLDDEYIAIK
jgi:predicted AAA+ superfamily ATPase